MKKLLRGFLCASVVAGILLGNAQCIFAGDTGATYSVTTDAAEVKVGDTFTVYVQVTNNPGINAITGYLDYDPTKVQAQKAVAVETIDTFISEATLNTQITGLKPTSKNADYADLGADGTKTAAELGRIKVAGYLYDSATSSLGEAATDGNLFAIEFKSLSAGDAVITFDAFKATNAAISNVDVTSATASGTFTSTGGEGGDGTTKYYHYAGDLNIDGKPDSGDATLVIRSIVSPGDQIEAGTDQYIIADVSGQDGVDSTDASDIIKKIVNPNFSFTIGDIVEVSKDYYAEKGLTSIQP